MRVVVDWRDVGWSFKCVRKGAELAVNLAGIGEDSWLLQMGPAVVPNVFARLVGKRPSATRAECTDAARVVNEILGHGGRYSMFRWCRDGFPNADTSTAEPTEWAD